MSHRRRSSTDSTREDGSTEPPLDRGITPEPGRDAAAALALLTVRELEVLQRVSRGAPSKRVALELEITEHTVKTHLNHVYRKLGVANRVEAAARYIDHQHAKAITRTHQSPQLSGTALPSGSS
jgi:DNA-binding CsgD family transcriptional regulator